MKFAARGEEWGGTHSARPFELFSEIAKRCTAHVVGDTRKAYSYMVTEYLGPRNKEVRYLRASYRGFSTGAEVHAPGGILSARLRLRCP